MLKIKKFTDDSCADCSESEEASAVLMSPTFCLSATATRVPTGRLAVSSIPYGLVLLKNATLLFVCVTFHSFANYSFTFWV